MSEAPATADSTAPLSRVSIWWKILLVASLALNLLFIGGRLEEARTFLSKAETHKAQIHPELKKAVLGRDQK